MRARIELVTMAVVMAALLKGFVIDAYKIPTGSMQPTLFGDRGAELSDRILVDRVTYAWRDPRRFEVAVFRYPLDHAKTYVKRVVGVGPEELRIAQGDLFHRRDDTQPWTILRRPEDVQERHWLAIEGGTPQGPEWIVSSMGSEWSVSGRSLRARGDGRAQFVPVRGTIRDWYLDGYPDALRELITHRSQRSGRHAVGDVRLDAQVRALPGSREVTLELFEGGRRYAFRLPGPAAPADAKPSIEAFDEQTRTTSALASAGWRLPADEAVQVRVQNLDDRLELRIEGQEPLTLEVGAVRDPNASLFVMSRGEGVDLDELRVYRDVYYTNDEAKRSTYTIPADHYFMLGDNSQDSSDSRDWMLYRLRSAGPAETPGDREAGTETPGRIVRGEARRRENPRTVNAATLPGPTLYFEDEWGEPHWLDPETTETLSPEHVPFVHRDQILGRAVAVFWPIDPRRNVFRPGFVR